ncbi:hypothetical protein Dsin_006534 [Dipteronia sinensis]|uniref:Carboxypeptidase n=1 Tax=Dipteronia sinensis TaxID=43782 RepID=A0AAE0EG87_9ROSI|nr:hypothetical protein Dsin_006534 [Dipteronia sinensis]
MIGQPSKNWVFGLEFGLFGPPSDSEYAPESIDNFQVQNVECSDLQDYNKHKPKPVHHKKSVLLRREIFLHGYFALDAGTNDGSEQWGYVEVRPKAHLFWWLYKSPNRVEDPSKPWPILLWLQGGPGASGVGLGNFLEIGPLDGHLKPRNYTWLKKADLLFVDSPVGTGFSYMEDESLVVKTDEDAATDLTTLLKMIFNGNENLQKSPLYIFAESYGGKFAVTLGLSALKAIQAGQLKLQLGGVALGNSWISPEDIVFSWAPLLKDLSRMNNNGLNISNSLALNIKQQIAEGKYENATSTWEELENVIAEYSNNVVILNFSARKSIHSTGFAKSN